jgi:hypothetical protein
VFAGGGECPAGAAYPQEEKVKQKSNRIKQKKGLLGSLFFFCLLSIITKKFRAILCIFFLDKRRCGRSILCQEEKMKFSKK